MESFYFFKFSTPTPKGKGYHAQPPAVDLILVIFFFLLEKSLIALRNIEK